jgi:hypothetical protein
MTLQRSHGRPYPGVAPLDELPDPIPDNQPAASGLSRRPDGTVNTPEAAAALGAKGGRARGTGVKLARSLGLGKMAENAAFTPYLRSAASFRQHHCAELARMAGGQCGSGPSSMVASASLQLAASRYVYEQAIATGDVGMFKVASSLADASRQNLLAAYEMAVKEATAREESAGDDVHARRLENARRLGGG